MKDLAKRLLSLKREDIALLKAIEAGMKRYQWVPIEEVAHISGIAPSRADFLLGQLASNGIIFCEEAKYLGYAIGFDTYDLLALRVLVDRGAVRSLGEIRGVGKESIVVEALGEVPLVIKFHREGQTSFKHVRRYRDHLADKSRCTWIYAARLAAGREFQILKRLHTHVSVPRPIALNRHALAMELVEGPRLDRAELDRPEEIMDLILDEIGNCLRLGLVHADLSEYNVFLDGDGVKIIDWPQAIALDHPNAQERLERDVGNIVKFFRRRFGIERSLETALKIVSDRENGVRS
ncbi:MAG: serine/threonine protein kinase [Methanotrichaceae archaeon]|nr:serine/threonine protein kinase [Methanotrichaceae archaeon]